MRTTTKHLRPILATGAICLASLAGCGISTSNAIKHSEAELITVRIRTGDRLTVQVSDDGVGMTGSATGHGMTGMRDRVV